MNGRRILSIALRMLVFAALLTLPGALGAAPAAAEGPVAEGPSEAAWWQVDSRTAPRYLPAHAGETALIEATANDLGDASVRGTKANPVKLTDTVPAGLVVTKVSPTAGSSSNLLQTPSCSQEPAAGGTEVECEFEGTLQPYERLQAQITVTTTELSVTGAENVVSVSGGEAVGGEDGDTALGTPSPESFSSKLTASGEAAPFGVERYEVRAEEASGQADASAGSHPFQMTTTLDLDQTYEPLPGSAEYKPAVNYQARNLDFTLPAGLLGNTTAVPQCPDGAFSTLLEKNINLCKPETAIGVALVTINEPDVEPGATEAVPVFNLVPADGEPARLGFTVEGVPVYLDTEVLSGSDYAVRVDAHNTSRTASLLKSVVTIWGEPGDPRHDRARGWECVAGGSHVKGLPRYEKCQQPTGLASKPYLRMPTRCTGSPLQTGLSGESWPRGQEPSGVPLMLGSEAEGTHLQMAALGGCEKLSLDPTISVLPDETSASTPTGLKVTLETPQREAGGLSESDIGANTVELPVGVQASAGAANGLETCSGSQMGFNLPGNANFVDAALPESAQTGNEDFSAELPSCAAASKIGAVSIKTPLLPEDLVGSVYMSSQNTNPFASPLAIYLVARAPVSGVLVKLAGEVSIDPANGQLVTTFKNTPDTPFEKLELELFNGPRASQATPAFCADYTTNASFTPTSAPATTIPRSSGFAISSGPGGGPCPGSALPFEPKLQTESIDPQAGAFTPFKMTIDRPDGQQQIERITLNTPPGLAADIASVPALCANPQSIPLETGGEPCSEASKIGTTTAISGLGGEPVELHGNVYLTEGYGGAPFGLLVSTKAQAGPFNLGYVNVRSKIFINRETTAVTVASEPIPTIVKGVPSQLKQIVVEVNRPNFEFNPTDCEGTSITGTVNGSEAASVGLGSPFKVENCGSLPFAPKLTATVSGQGSKVNGTRFVVKIESPGLGQANIHKVDLTLPEVLPSRQSTIEKACLEAVFNANPASCDEGSVIGEGVVHTPVFKDPLRGPAYLVSHGAAAFPDVEFVLQGEGEAQGVEIIVDGKTDIKKGITYSRFETSPDAPFTSFESIFPQSPHSAVTAYVSEKEDFNLCNSTSRLLMPTTIVGQNGAKIEQTTHIVPEGCGGVKSNQTRKLTRAQKLNKALKACRSKYKGRKKKSKRLSCEKQAHKKYGPKPKKSSKKSAKKKKKK